VTPPSSVHPPAGSAREPLSVLLVSVARPAACLADIAPMAGRIAARRLARVWMVHWSDLERGEQGLRIAVSGAAVPVGKRSQSTPRRRRFDVLLFYPTSDSAADFSPREKSALDALAVGAQFRCSRYAVVRHLLVRAARRGQITNATGNDGNFGIKTELAGILDEFEKATGCCVPRPRTWNVRGSAPDEIGAAASPCARFIFKPANNARGLGIRIDTDFGGGGGCDGGGTWIKQELLADPLLVGSFKADIRAYVVIDTSSRENCAIPREMLVRLAAYPYRRGELYAELTNSSVRQRLGLPQSTTLLDATDVIPPLVRRRIAAQVKNIGEKFLDSYFWYAETQPVCGPRVLLWGLDFFIAGPASDYAATLLEVNAYPSLFVTDKEYGEAIVRVMQSQLSVIAVVCKRADDPTKLTSASSPRRRSSHHPAGGS